MKPLVWLWTSLARKVSILFGVAVLATILVTLAFPWMQMSALNQQVVLLQAKRAAGTVFQAVDLHQPDWGVLQDELERRWALLAEKQNLPGGCPTLVPATEELCRSRGFRHEAAERLNRRPEQAYYWRIQEEGRILRYAAAVRRLNTDPHPDVLRGLIDVRLPMPIERSVWNSVATVLAGASGAVLAILAFFVVTQRFVLSPVETLRQAAQKVGAGDWSARSSIHSGDEFQHLSDAFNNMLVRLREAQERQELINRSLDIKLGELAQSNVVLFEANRLKSEFLANVSHELRTPLVSIIGFAELLRDAWGNPNVDRIRLARFTENILVSGRNLLDIINDLLDLAKIEAGRVELHVSEFDIGSLCRDLVDFVKPLAEKKSQPLELHEAGPACAMRSDSGRIKQILYNLLSNAIKFTPAEGRIVLTVDTTAGGTVRLSVSDSGPGIPRDKQAVIFEKFRQLDSSKTREYEGTGLGLAITKELVQILGGAIRLESDQGQGATFFVELPILARPTGLVPSSPMMLTG